VRARELAWDVGRDRCLDDVIASDCEFQAALGTMAISNGGKWNDVIDAQGAVLSWHGTGH
jgi:hypothetical protein